MYDQPIPDNLDNAAVLCCTMPLQLTGAGDLGMHSAKGLGSMHATTPPPAFSNTLQ